jgi:hypothetical protein
MLGSAPGTGSAKLPVKPGPWTAHLKRKEQSMKTSSTFGTVTANALILLTPALIGPIAIAEGFADVAKPIVVEIDKAVMRIDIAAAVRAIRENLNDAHAVAPDGRAPPEDVKLAISEPPPRG